MAQPIPLYLAAESHAGCMKRAIALAVAEENASLVVSATAEHARIGPDHCRGCFGFRGGCGGHEGAGWSTDGVGPGGDGWPSQSDALTLNGACRYDSDDYPSERDRSIECRSSLERPVYIRR